MPIFKAAVRFSDEDNQGHVNHLAIIEYVAEARIDFIDGIIKSSGVKGVDYVLVHINIDFLKKISYPGAVHVNPEVVSVGNKSLKTKYALFHEDILVSRADCVNVFFNLKTGKTVPIPVKLREALKG